MASITGIGFVPPSLAHDEQRASAVWARLLRGPTLVGRLTRFVSEELPKLAGEVPDIALVASLDERTQRTTSHVAQLGMVAGSLALADSQLEAGAIHPLDLGVLAGSALAGWAQGEKQVATFLEKGAKRVNPFLVNSTGRHAITTELAAKLGAQGICSTVSTGCVSSVQAIGDAQRLLASRELAVCIAGGAESPLSSLVMATLARTEELSQRADDCRQASRPFDRQHDGMVLSEGACFLVLEREELARSRGARVYAEVLGGTSSCDARGLYHFDETGEAGARAIHRLLERTGVTVDQIDYVCAHANSSPAFDRKEALVLKRAFGEFAAKIPVSSIKGVLGHPFGASGAFQTAAAALAMQHSLIPPTHNLEDPDPECDLDLVIGEPRPATIRHALITSYGYGGVNAYLLLRNPNS